MRDEFSSDGAPSFFSGRLYQARWKGDWEAFLEDSTLRGLVTKLLQESRTDLDAFSIDSRSVSTEEDEGSFELPLGVPSEEFSYQVEGALQFLPLDSIPLHWELPLPHTYVAVDLERALWTREPRLDSLVRRLHQLGYARVRPRSFTIYALLASANPEVDDVVVVPFDLYTEKVLRNKEG